jgi:hypothetical protein
MQYKISCALFLLVLGNTAAAVQILPTPYADRTFQFIRTSQTFMGTPLQTKALTPYALFVIGSTEQPDFYPQAATIAYMIGQWTQEPGTSLEKVKTNQNLGPVLLDRQLTPEQISHRNLVIIGKNNNIYPRIEARLSGKGTFIEVVEDALAPGQDIMFVSDAKAASYLANKRLYFKSGAYKGFFSFAKARALIDKGEFAEALNSLDNPEAIRGCGKPVILAIGHKEKLPPELLRVAKARNQLVFKDLRASLMAKDKTKAIAVWQEAMGTCYGCHQGRGGVTQFRKFKPNQQEHGYHTVIASQFDMRCETCHHDLTKRVGY